MNWANQHGLFPHRLDDVHTPIIVVNAHEVRLSLNSRFSLTLRMSYCILLFCYSESTVTRFSFYLGELNGFCELFLLYVRLSSPS